MVVDHLMALMGCTYLNFEFKHRTHLFDLKHITVVYLLLFNY